MFKMMSNYFYSLLSRHLNTMTVDMVKRDMAW